MQFSRQLLGGFPFVDVGSNLLLDEATQLLPEGFMVFGVERMLHGY